MVGSIAPHRAGGAVWRCGRWAGPGQGLCGVAAHAGQQQQLVEDAGGAGSAGQRLHGWQYRAAPRRWRRVVLRPAGRKNTFIDFDNQKRLSMAFHRLY
jgi:hypothetical protein